MKALKNVKMKRPASAAETTSRLMNNLINFKNEYDDDEEFERIEDNAEIQPLELETSNLVIISQSPEAAVVTNDAVHEVSFTSGQNI